MAYYIIIRGPLGCGKTTIAEKLSHVLDASHIAVDPILDEHHLTSEYEDGYISQKSFLKANEIIVPVAQRSLTKGIPVVFDGNFYWKSQVDDLVSRLEFPGFVFTLKAPLELCIDRDSKRPSPHGEDAARVVYAKVNSFDVGIIIDVTKNVEDTVAEIRSYLPKSLA